MIKLLVLTLLLSILLPARENPFFPSNGEVDMPLSSNQSQSQEPLKRAAITLPSTARNLQSVSISFQNLDGSIEKKSISLNNSIDWHLPLFISQNYDLSDSSTIETTTKEKKYVELASLPFSTLYLKEKEIKIVTKDKMLRNFFLVKPHRIVCDFQRDIDIRSYSKNIKTKSVVKRVRFGNHKGYYRVVIELDGYYRYNLSREKDKYIFHLL